MSTTTKQTIGTLRRQADVRQLAAMLMFTGICAIFHPIGNVVAAIGPDGTTPSSGTPLAGLFGGLILNTIGILSIFVGYNELVHGWGNKNLTAACILFTQTVYTAYVSDMAGIGQAARTGMAFIPAVLEPTEQAVRFVAACGIVGVIAYGFTFAGTIAFFQFAIYTYQAGKPENRSGRYFAGRMLFYCGMLLLAGVAQLALGAFLATKYGANRLEGTVGVAMFVVNYPVVSMLVGIFQIFNGLWGLCRSFGFLVFGERDLSYPISMGILWFTQFLLQVVVQVGIGGPVPAGAAIFALTVGQNIMPAFLDYKARTLPDEIDSSYYEEETDMEEA